MGGVVADILLNGEPRTVTAGTTLAALLGELGLDPTTVAIERNREIVPRSDYADTQLAEGDALEVVTFVGGG
jgi:thiamine biosynthesis protein ThiS